MVEMWPTLKRDLLPPAPAPSPPPAPDPAPEGNPPAKPPPMTYFVCQAAEPMAGSPGPGAWLAVPRISSADSVRATGRHLASMRASSAGALRRTTGDASTMSYRLIGHEHTRGPPSRMSPGARSRASYSAPHEAVLMHRARAKLEAQMWREVQLRNSEGNFRRNPKRAASAHAMSTTHSLPQWRPPSAPVWGKGTTASTEKLQPSNAAGREESRRPPTRPPSRPRTAPAGGRGGHHVHWYVP